MATAEMLSNSKSNWYLDSGTTSHIINNWNAFTEFMATSATPVLEFGNPAMILGYGTITIKFKVNNKFVTHKLQHMLYIPEAPNCLLSASRFDETGSFKKENVPLKTKMEILSGMGYYKGNRT